LNYAKRTATIIGILILFLSGCKKDTDLPIKENFIGRWVLVEVGNYPSMEPYNSSKRWGLEFLEDSIIHSIDDTGILGTEKYWVDSLLHVACIRNNRILFTEEYEYKFLNNEKLFLEQLHVASNYTTFIYKRIN
jgi:hypothetical protein